ncbi:MAG TPA: DUF4157 domain-containing protein [Flavobacteriaceae bacterium]|jgi:hypothetical protein|nr:DUF4157 domain-containing protein [Flavobacteriaceae bacterium]HIN99762.1 DUF4157 domain-containing protein [Flavobacteriaceae bacterium]|tara:strand:- start:31266 stop:33689 length:2424 start_codon:yes stop_codon:yes gene_type:complete
MRSSVQKSEANNLPTTAPQHTEAPCHCETSIHDNRPETAAQLQLQKIANGGVQATRIAQLQQLANNNTQPAIIQKKENKTGLPDQLKSGIEQLSGHSMDDVKVHRNSDKPATLQAHAYAQGTDIHLGPGQEKHLPHEAWHVVQQKQGRVKPTLQMRGHVNVNDDMGLEKEADVMGAKAMHIVQKKEAGETDSEEKKAKKIEKDSSCNASLGGKGGFSAATDSLLTKSDNLYAKMVQRKGLVENKSSSLGNVVQRIEITVDYQSVIIIAKQIISILKAMAPVHRGGDKEESEAFVSDQRRLLDTTDLLLRKIQHFRSTDMGKVSAEKANQALAFELNELREMATAIKQKWFDKASRQSLERERLRPEYYEALAEDSETTRTHTSHSHIKTFPLKQIPFKLLPATLRKQMEAISQLRGDRRLEEHEEELVKPRSFHQNEHGMLPYVSYTKPRARKQGKSDGNEYESKITRSEFINIDDVSGARRGIIEAFEAEYFKTLRASDVRKDRGRIEQEQEQAHIAKHKGKHRVPEFEADYTGFEFNDGNTPYFMDPMDNRQTGKAVSGSSRIGRRDDYQSQIPPYTEHTIPAEVIAVKQGGGRILYNYHTGKFYITLSHYDNFIEITGAPRLEAEHAATASSSASASATSTSSRLEEEGTSTAIHSFHEPMDEALEAGLQASELHIATAEGITEFFNIGHASGTWNACLIGSILATVFDRKATPEEVAIIRELPAVAALEEIQAEEPIDITSDAGHTIIHAINAHHEVNLAVYLVNPNPDEGPPIETPIVAGVTPCYIYAAPGHFIPVFKKEGQ